jgi:hypothetical protein
LQGTEKNHGDQNNSLEVIEFFHRWNWISRDRSALGMTYQYPKPVLWHKRFYTILSLAASIRDMGPVDIYMTRATGQAIDHLLPHSTS